MRLLGSCASLCAVNVCGMKTSTKTSLVAVGIVVALLVVMLWYPLKAARNVSKLRACMENLKLLDVALSVYLKDHGRYPAKLADLYPKYVSNLNLFVCPGNPRKIDSPEEIDSEGGYVLLLRGVTPSEADFRPLLCDRRSNHLDKVDLLYGGNILFDDAVRMWKPDKRSDVEWESSDKFDFPA